MAKINVQTLSKDDGWTFRVEVSEDSSRTEHTVRMSRRDYERLTGKACSPEECIIKSFEFLLEREPKESILKEFEVTVISRYFPEYERELARCVRGFRS